MGVAFTVDSLQLPRAVGARRAAHLAALVLALNPTLLRTRISILQLPELCSFCWRSTPCCLAVSALTAGPSTRGPRLWLALMRGPFQPIWRRSRDRDRVVLAETGACSLIGLATPLIVGASAGRNGVVFDVWRAAHGRTHERRKVDRHGDAWPNTRAGRARRRLADLCSGPFQPLKCTRGDGALRRSRDRGRTATWRLASQTEVNGQPNFNPDLSGCLAPTLRRQAWRRARSIPARRGNRAQRLSPTTPTRLLYIFSMPTGAT